jgi:tetrahydromethanopterin S-methyltransferase subunit C
MITWPLSSHIIFALATGIACGIVGARYLEVISPPYAAIFGTLVVYPVMVAMWWRLHRPGGRGR